MKLHVPVLLVGALSLSLSALAAQDQAAPKAPAVLVIKPSGSYLDLPEQGGDLSALLMGAAAASRSLSTPSSPSSKVSRSRRARTCSST